MLIGAFRSENSVLPFVRSLKRRTWEDVDPGIASILSELYALVGQKGVVRIHSDRAKEFLAKNVSQHLNEAGLHQTTTSGHDPAANGLAERMVGLLKEKVREFLVKGSVHVTYWPYLFGEAARVYRDQTLGKSWQGELPYPGEAVAVKVIDPAPLEARAEPGVFLGRADAATNGAFVQVVRNGKPTVILTRLPALLKKTSERWRTFTTFSGDLVWISSSGEARSADDVRDIGIDLGLLTVEETQRGQSPLEGYAVAAVGATSSETALQPDLDIEGKYTIANAAAEDEMTDAEEMLKILTGQRASAEIVDTKVFFSGTDDEKKKWLDAAKKEIGQMLDQQVWKAIPEDGVRTALELGPKEPLPRVLPMRLVMAKKPDLEAEPVSSEGATKAAEIAEAAFKAKVRLVACGNFQPNQEIDESEIACENLNPEALRLMYGRLASEDLWEALSLDISAAFLNSPLPKHEKILLRPPAVLEKLGLVPPKVLFWAHKSIYGLRRGPKDWQSERTDKMHGAILEPRAEHVFGKLRLEELEECKGLFAIKNADTSKIEGILAMFVDDGFIFGPREVMLRVKGQISKTWKCQVQGFLTRTGDVEIRDGDEVIKKVEEITFLGTQVSLEEDGAHVSQRKWLVRELHRRGLVHLRGCESLPHIDATQIPQLRKDRADYANLLKKSQGEIGCLQWLGLKTRPDIQACVGILASLQTWNPEWVYQASKGVWRYLRATVWSEMIHHEKGSLDIYAESDASLGPSGSRSRTGVVISVGKNVVFWKSCRQCLTAFSTCEAETDACASALYEAGRIAELLRALTGYKPKLILAGDNSASITSITKQDFNPLTWRTRHFALRCAWVRDMLHGGLKATSISSFSCIWKPGAELAADALTKVLSRTRLAMLRSKLGVHVQVGRE